MSWFTFCAVFSLYVGSFVNFRKEFGELSLVEVAKVHLQTCRSLREMLFQGSVTLNVVVPTFKFGPVHVITQTMDYFLETPFVMLYEVLISLLRL